MECFLCKGSAYFLEQEIGMLNRMYETEIMLKSGARGCRSIYQHIPYPSGYPYFR